MINITPTLSSDSLTGKKISYLILMTIVLLTLSFYTINVEGVMQQALIYWILLITAIVIWVMSKVIEAKKGLDFPNPILWEDTTTFGKLSTKTHIAILLVFILIGSYLFSQIGSAPTFQIVSSPHFQLIKFSPTVGSILDGVAGMVEDLVFWGIVLPLIFGISYYFTKNFVIALIIALMLTPFIFMSFHIGVYGFNQIVTMQKVYIFGFLMSLLVYTFRNVLLASCIHFANNASLSYFSAIKVANPFIFFYVTLFAVIVIFVISFRRRKEI